MDDKQTKDESASEDNSRLSKDNNNDSIDDNSFISDASKRKLLESEHPVNSSFKKARFSWQVKGSKEKNNDSATDFPANSPENISETFDSESVKSAMDIPQPVLNASQAERKPLDVSYLGSEVRQSSNVRNQSNELRQPSNVRNQNFEVSQTSNVRNENRGFRQPPNLSSQQLFHAMDFDPPSAALQTDYQSDNGSSSTVPQEHLDIFSDYLHNSSSTNSSSLSNPPRIKHFSTSLHACMVNAIIPVVRPITNDNLNRPTASVSVIAPNNTTNISTNNGGRERDEFRDALLSIRRPNLSENEKWEKRNTAGAIVDNVFNRTLEEMGISPDAASNRRSMDRTAVENQSILAAISSQGLTANRTETSEATAEISEVQNNFEYLRQNQAVFNRTFERLGYRRYDVIQRHIPSTQGTQTNTDIAQNQVQTENLASRTSDNVLSSQHDEDSDSCVHDNESVQSGMSHLETDVLTSGGYRADLNIRVENIPSSSRSSDITSCTENKLVEADTKRDNEASGISRNNETKEKDVGVSENVLNLALSAAIQSQGLTLK